MIDYIVFCAINHSQKLSVDSLNQIIDSILMLTTLEMLDKLVFCCVIWTDVDETVTATACNLWSSHYDNIICYIVTKPFIRKEHVCLMPLILWDKKFHKHKTHKNWSTSNFQYKIEKKKLENELKANTIEIDCSCIDAWSRTNTVQREL